MGEYHGKIVHTSGSIGRRGVAQGIICRSCPGGCKTDCLRAGVINDLYKVGTYDFDANFAEVDPNANDDDFEY